MLLLKVNCYKKSKVSVTVHTISQFLYKKVYKKVIDKSVKNL